MSTFTLKIVEEERAIYEESASLVTLPGILGEVGFLAHHAPYIVGLKEGLIKVYGIQKNFEKPFKTFIIKKGHAYFSNNHCILCVKMKKEAEVF